MANGADLTGHGFKVRRHRRAENHKFRLKKPAWVDPFPGIPGTGPEKRLFAALKKRGIYFVFQGSLREYVGSASPILEAREFEPDFLIPEWKVIFDPFGEFAHTQTDSMARDTVKSVYYRSLGYAFYHQWASYYDTNVEQIIDAAVELWGPRRGKLCPLDTPACRAQGYRLGKNLGAGATGTAKGNTARAAHRIRTGHSLVAGSGRGIRRGR